MSIRDLSSSELVVPGEGLVDDAMAGVDKLGRDVLASDLR